MGNTIPSKIVRKVIFDILLERSNSIDDDCDALIKKDMAEFGAVDEYAIEVGWTACGTRVLADDILYGIMSLEEAVECLTSEERKEAKARCKNWLDEKSKKVAREHLQKIGSIDENGKLKPPYNWERVHEDDFTRGPREFNGLDESER